jgi:ATP-dependent Clp protease ATP-binding subunit ClpA
MKERFTARALRILSSARQMAASKSDSTVSANHILAALLDDSVGAHVYVLQALGVRLSEAKAALGLESSNQVRPSEAKPTMSLEAERAIRVAMSEARQLRHNYVGTEHLLFGLTTEAPAALTRPLKRLGVTPARVRHIIQNPTSEGWGDDHQTASEVRCKVCGYDMRGSPTGLCPECGSPNG